METLAAVEGKSGEAGLLRDFFTEDELARELDRSKKTLLRWEREGRGPRRTKLGRKVLYRREAVREWLAACEADPDRRGRRFGVRPQSKRRT